MRAYNGSGNNIAHPSWGSTNTPFRATSVRGPSFAWRDLPFAARVSEMLLKQDHYQLRRNQTSSMTDLFSYFGQWIALDLSGTIINASEMQMVFPHAPNESSACPSPYPFTRSRHTTLGGQREPLNGNTAYIDAEQVYGNCEECAAALRTFSGGQLRESSFGESPHDSDGQSSCPVRNPRGLPRTRLRFSGSRRVNEVTPLVALTSVFVREHNRQCLVLASTHPTWTDQQLYDRARMHVIALVQRITMYEYLPKLVGPVKVYSGYDPLVDPSILSIFGAAAFRFGHSTISPSIKLRSSCGEQEGEVPLRAAMYEETPDAMIESVLVGLIQGQSYLTDLQIVDDLRTTLLSDVGIPNADLGAIDLLRGRDHELPKYNDARVSYSLPAITSFEQLTDDAELQGKLSSLYGGVSEIDTYVGLLLERSIDKLPIGPLGRSIIVGQFDRIRAGDRYWYENRQGAGPMLNASELEYIRETTLGDVLSRNTKILPKVSALPFMVESPCNELTDSGILAIQVDPDGLRWVEFTVSAGHGEDVGMLSIMASVPRDTWLGIGFGATDGAMQNADIITIHTGAKYEGCAQDAAETTFVCDRTASNWHYEDVTVPLDTSLGGSSDVQLLRVDWINGVATVLITRPLNTHDKFDAVVGEHTFATFAYSESVPFDYHGPRTKTARIDFHTGMIDLKAILLRRGSQTLHGAFMTIAWGFLVPLGFMIARYCHRNRGQWMGVHVTMNVFAVLCTWPGFFIARTISIPSRTGSFEKSVHGQIGTVIMVWSNFHLLTTVLARLAEQYIKKTSQQESLSNPMRDSSGSLHVPSPSFAVVVRRSSCSQDTLQHTGAAARSWLMKSSRACTRIIDALARPVCDVLVALGRLHQASGLLLAATAAIQLIIGLCLFKQISDVDIIFLWFVWYGTLLGICFAIELWKFLVLRMFGGVPFLIASTQVRPEYPLPETCDWHLFLSHVWPTGQDQVAVIKRRLAQLAPGAKCFLDVDDLRELTQLEACVKRSAAVLIFLSQGYFDSTNALREVRSAVANKKPIILVHEEDEHHGGLPLASIQLSCPECLRVPLQFDRNEAPVIPWHRQHNFQLLSLKLICERMLQALPHPFTDLRGPVRLTYKDEPDPRQLGFSFPLTIHASGSNPGARALVDEFVSFFPSLSEDDLLTPRSEHRTERSYEATSSSLPDLVESNTTTRSVFLVYLNEDTFAGPEGLVFADELRHAFETTVQLLLVHENDPNRRGCRFAKFFETTPKDLIEKGIYDTLACSFFAPPHRELSIALAALALGAKRENAVRRLQKQSSAYARSFRTRSCRCNTPTPSRLAETSQRSVQSSGFETSHIVSEPRSNFTSKWMQKVGSRLRKKQADDGTGVLIVPTRGASINTAGTS